MVPSPDPSTLATKEPEALYDTTRAKVLSTSVLLRHLSAALHEPASLETASSLLVATLELLNRPGHRSRDELTREVSLANAALLAVIDLVKSHADAPGVRALLGKSGPR